MRTLFLFLLLCGTSSAQTVITFSIREPLTSYGYTPQQMRDAIPKAFAYFEKIANVDCRLVPSGGQYVIDAKTLHAPWLGVGVHVRGQFVGNTISIHNGWVPAHTRHPSKPRESIWWKAYGSEQAIASVLAHEIGHTPHFFGTAHSSDRACLMHPDGGSDLCPAEKARLVAKYGPAPIKNWSWQNPANKFDVNNDGQVTSLDALAVINAVARDEQVDTSKPPTKFYDVNDDGKISSLDALSVTNELNRS